LKTKILSRRRNELLNRGEISFEILHEKGGTPTRLEVRKQLASMLSVNIDCVIIKKIETKRGSTATIGEANIYDSVEQVKYTEPSYIISRNIPKEKSQEGE